MAALVGHAGRTGVELVIGCNANSQSEAWDSTNTNNRGEVRAKKPSLTLNLGTNGLKVTSEPPPMAGKAGRLQGQDRSAVNYPSSGHARRCLIVWWSSELVSLRKKLRTLFRREKLGKLGRATMRLNTLYSHKVRRIQLRQLREYRRRNSSPTFIVCRVVQSF
ncbi:hypothetical protein J6590_039839 [Homalodisca vitripennis]|nr:hypothetical protein J6590_039839 [Homalodisca vitripennis]